MKKGRIALAVVLALAMMFTLGACSIEFGGEETWEYTADNKEGATDLFRGFFEETFKNTNQVVTAKSDGEVKMIETIDGTSDYVQYPSTTGTETYSFIKDGEYIYGMTGEDYTYYMVGETNYNYGYFVYKQSIDFFDMLPEEGLTYSVAVKGSKKGDNSTSTMTAEIKNGDLGSLTISATSKNDLVDVITVTRTEGDKTAVSTFEITYGNASVTIPDMTDWVKEDL